MTTATFKRQVTSESQASTTTSSAGSPTKTKSPRASSSPSDVLSTSAREQNNYHKNLQAQMELKAKLEAITGKSSGCSVNSHKGKKYSADTTSLARQNNSPKTSAYMSKQLELKFSNMHDAAVYARGRSCRLSNLHKAAMFNETIEIPGHNPNDQPAKACRITHESVLAWKAEKAPAGCKPTAVKRVSEVTEKEQFRRTQVSHADSQGSVSLATALSICAQQGDRFRRERVHSDTG